MKAARSALRSATPDMCFSERMRGWLSFDEQEYNPAVVAGPRAGTECSAELTVEIDHLERFLADEHRTARLRGVVRCPELGGRLDGVEGSFKLFVRAPDERRRRVLYRLCLSDRERRPL